MWQESGRYDDVSQNILNTVPTRTHPHYFVKTHNYSPYLPCLLE